MEHSETCKLHGTKLKRRKVPIHYGLPAFDDAWDVQEKLFPNANSYSLGGCVIDLDNPTHGTAMVCEDCREALSAWRKEQELTCESD